MVDEVTIEDLKPKKDKFTLSDLFDDEINEQMTYQKINENDDNWIILNQDRKTSYSQQYFIINKNQ